AAQRKADEEKKAEEAKVRAAAAAAASPAPAAPPAAPPPGRFDGTYTGSYSQTNGVAAQMSVRPVSLHITGAAGTGSMTHPSCGPASISVRVSPAGDVSGEATLFDNNCGPVQGTLVGRVADGRLQFKAAIPGANGSADLTRAP